MIETQINLRRWLNGKNVEPGQPSSSAEQLRNFYSWLGDRTELKELYVRRLLWLDDKTTAQIDNEIDELTGTTRKTDPLRKTRRSKYGPVMDCWHLTFRVLEINLRSIGAGGWRMGMEPEGASAKAMSGARKSYLVALDAYLGNVSLTEAREKNPEHADRIAEVYGLLKAPDETKRWLTGCLWKKLKSGDHMAGSDEYDRDQESAPSNWLSADAGS
jgi:hypothetical protein